MRIVVGIDGGMQQQDALALGAQLAGLEAGSLTVAYAYPWSKWAESLGNAYELTEREEAQRVLGTAREQLGVERATYRAIPSLSAPRALHELAQELDADAIVLGSCHRGPIGRATLGGTADRVIAGAPCAVVVAPRGHEAKANGLKRIGVAWDGSADSEVALTWASQLAQSTGGTLTLLTVIEPMTAGMYPATVAFGYSELRDDMRADCLKRQDKRIAALAPELGATGRVLDGPAVPHAIADAAAELDLVVAGSRGYGPLSRLLLGSVSRGIVHHSDVPVVVVPRPDEERADAGADPATLAGVM